MKNRVKILVLAALLSGGIPCASSFGELVEQDYMVISDYDLHTAKIWEIKLEEFLTSNCNNGQKAAEYLRQIKRMGGAEDSGEDFWLDDAIELLNTVNKWAPRVTTPVGVLWPDESKSALKHIALARRAITISSLAYHLWKGDGRGCANDIKTAVTMAVLTKLGALPYGSIVVFAWTMGSWAYESEQAAVTAARKSALSQAFGRYFTGKDVPGFYKRLKEVVEVEIGAEEAADVNACIDREIKRLVDEFADKPEIKVTLYKEHYESVSGGSTKFYTDVKELRDEVKWTLYQNGVYDRLVKDATRACMKLAKREAGTVRDFFNGKLKFKVRIEDADGKAMDKYAGCHVWLRDSERKNDRRKMLGRIGKDGTAVIECTRLGYELAGLPTMCDIFKTSGTPGLSDDPILFNPFMVGKKNGDVEIVLKPEEVPIEGRYAITSIVSQRDDQETIDKHAPKSFDIVRKGDGLQVSLMGRVFDVSFDSKTGKCNGKANQKSGIYSYVLSLEMEFKTSGKEISCQGRSSCDYAVVPDEKDKPMFDETYSVTFTAKKSE